MPISSTILFEVETCCTCHMQFAVSTSFQNMCRNTHKTFYCPAGHSQSYVGRTELERLKTSLEDATNREVRLIKDLQQIRRKLNKVSKQLKQVSESKEKK